MFKIAGNKGGGHRMPPPFPSLWDGKLGIVHLFKNVNKVLKNVDKNEKVPEWIMSVLFLYRIQRLFRMLDRGLAEEYLKFKISQFFQMSNTKLYKD